VGFETAYKINIKISHFNFLLWSYAGWLCLTVQYSWHTDSCSERHSNSRHILKSEQVSSADILGSRCERIGTSENDCYMSFGLRNQRIWNVFWETNAKGKQTWKAGGNQDFERNMIKLWDAARHQVGMLLRWCLFMWDSEVQGNTLNQSWKSGTWFKITRQWVWTDEGILGTDR
jgi:hypothetical protein